MLRVAFLLAQVLRHGRAESLDVQRFAKDGANDLREAVSDGVVRHTGVKGAGDDDDRRPLCMRAGESK